MAVTIKKEKEQEEEKIISNLYPLFPACLNNKSGECEVMKVIKAL